MNTYDENRKIYFENLAVQVRELVVSEKLYTQHHLSLDDVADRLEVSRYYVSHAVNNYLGKSFITLVDELRIQEAIRLMGQAGTDKCRITDIASRAGFADRQLHIVDGKIFKIEEQHHDDTEEDTENEEER